MGFVNSRKLKAMWVALSREVLKTESYNLRSMLGSIYYFICLAGCHELEN